MSALCMEFCSEADDSGGTSKEKTNMTQYLCRKCDTPLEEVDIEMGGKVDIYSNNPSPTPKFTIKGYKCPKCDKG